MGGTKGEGTRKRQANARCICQDCGIEFLAFRSDTIRCPVCRKAKTRVYLKANGEREREKFWRFEEGHKHPCPDCGNPVTRRAIRCKTCFDKQRKGKPRGAGSANWQNGVHISDGYRYIRVAPNYENGRPYQLEHHLVWERANGKPLPAGWVIHHLNGDKLDNRLENLAAMARNHHHTHPREALRPYERRIKRLEEELQALQRLRMDL